MMSETGEEAIRRLARLDEEFSQDRSDPVWSGEFSDTTSPTYVPSVGGPQYPRETSSDVVAIPVGDYGSERKPQRPTDESVDISEMLEKMARGLRDGTVSEKVVPTRDANIQASYGTESDQGSQIGINEGQTYAVHGHQDFTENDVPSVAVPPPNDVFVAAQSPMIATPRPEAEPDFIATQTSQHAAREYPDLPVLTDQGLHSYHAGTPEVEPATEPAPKPVSQAPVVRREDKKQERKDKRTEVKDANKGFVENQAAKAGAWLTSWWVANMEFARANNNAISVREVDRPAKGLKWYKKPVALTSYGVAQTGAHISYGARSATQGVQTLARGLFLPVTTGIEVATFENVRQNAGTLPAAMLTMSTLLLSKTVFEVGKFREDSPEKLVGALAREHEGKPTDDEGVAKRARPEMKTDPDAQEYTTKAEGYQQPREKAADSQYYSGTDDEDVASADGALPARTGFQYR